MMRNLSTAKRRLSYHKEIPAAAYVLAFRTQISLTPLATMLLVIISDVSRSLALAPSNKKTLQTHMIKKKYAIHVRLRMREVSHSYPTLQQVRPNLTTFFNPQ